MSKEKNINNIFENICNKCEKLKENKNKEWIHILKSINYDPQNGDITITADDIKKTRESWKGKSSQFEPRLLCKQDTKESRPEIFNLLGICIISLQNGTYLLTKCNIYHELESMNDIPIIKIKKNNSSLVLNIGNSESMKLDILRTSGIYERPEFLNEHIKYPSIFKGRHRASFDTLINGEKYKIKGSQFETDDCHESEHYIIIIEAKCNNTCNNEYKNFNIRQLYYPYRTIYDKFGTQKKIIPLFIRFDKNNIVNIWKYKWINPLELTNLSCVGQFRFKLID